MWVPRSTASSNPLCIAAGQDDVTVSEVTDRLRGKEDAHVSTLRVPLRKMVAFSDPAASMTAPQVVHTNFERRQLVDGNGVG